MASIIIGKTRPASKLNRSPIEQPFGDALWPRTTSLVGLPLLAGDLLAARAWPPVRGGSGVSMAAPAKRVASTMDHHRAVRQLLGLTLADVHAVERDETRAP